MSGFPAYNPNLLRVAVPCPLHAAFTYRLENGQSAVAGVRVRVPFGNRVVTGLVLGHEESDQTLSPEKMGFGEQWNQKPT
ncbi:hypothetical protein L4H84_004943 [Pseudomonas aeruginosa]